MATNFPACLRCFPRSSQQLADIKRRWIVGSFSNWLQITHETREFRWSCFSRCWLPSEVVRTEIHNYGNGIHLNPFSVIYGLTFVLLRLDIIYALILVHKLRGWTGVNHSIRGFVVLINSQTFHSQSQMLIHLRINNLNLSLKELCQLFPSQAASSTKFSVILFVSHVWLIIILFDYPFFVSHWKWLP